MINTDDTAFLALFKAHPVPMWVYDLDTLRFLAVNTAAVVHYGYSEADFLGMTIREVRPSADWSRLHDNLQQPRLQTIERAGTWRHLKKDGAIIDVEITSHPLVFHGRDCKFVLAHDTTERVLAQSKVTRLNRIYAVLSGINSAIVRARDRATLFTETCRIATVEGEFIAACIGELAPGADRGGIVARAGAELAFLASAPLTVQEDTPDNNWFACQAMRTKRPVVCNDLSQATGFARWRDAVAGLGILSMAAFPLAVGDRVTGVLLLFAAEEDYFDDAEMKLLVELASDVSFSLLYQEQDADRKRVTNRLQESEAGLRRAQVLNKSAHVVTGPDGVFESWSDTLPLLIGVPPTGMPPTTRHWLDIVHPDDRADFREACIQAGRTANRTQVAYRACRPDGSVVQLRQILEPLPGYTSADGRLRWFNTIQDVTEQERQHERIARLNRIYAVSSGINAAIARIHTRDALFQEACRVAVEDGAFTMAWMGIVDANTLDGRVVAWSGGDADLVQRIVLTARPDASASARPACAAVREQRAVICNDIVAEPALEPLAADLVEHGCRALAALPLTLHGRAVAVMVLCADSSGFFDAEEMKLLDKLTGDLNFALQFIDNAERLSFLAHYDALTGLPNRTLFCDRLNQSLRERDPSKTIACVVLVDLERFGQINDVLGRSAGDAVLRMVGERLGQALKESFSVARLVGDSFALALNDLADGATAAALVEQTILTSIEAVFLLEDKEMTVSARAGLALFPSDGDDAESLLLHAEIALKNARSSGVRVQYYAPQMNAANAARIALESALHIALDERQFVVHYQPRVDLVSGRIVSAEALIRWQHPSRGMVSPVEFIPLCEQTGLIVPIGAWVIDSVCAQQAAWRQQGLEIVPVAVNLSALQFKKNTLMQTIAQATARHGLEQRYLEFELTESVVMDDPEQAIADLQALKAIGAVLSLDDFGTGYSSLAYLQRFPFDFVKIDRSFVNEVTTNPGDAAIVSAVIAMAHSLKLQVVAEGVETEGQLRFLRQLRCDQLQGYYFSPAVVAAAFGAMLRDDKCLTLAYAPSQALETLLIVDDEPGNLSALNRSLRKQGYRVLTAGSGKEGLEILANNDVQVIISDQRMPEMSGTQFLTIVKSLYPDTIRIILSGYTELGVVTDSVNQGAVFKFLTKPWDDDLLRGHVRDAFRLYRPSALPIA
ncbi:MAG: EAL domain-containing protein [Pseudomonadota bacterium]